MISGVVSLYDLMVRYALDEFCGVYRLLCDMHKEMEISDLDVKDEYALVLAAALDTLMMHCRRQESDSKLIGVVGYMAESLRDKTPERRSPVLRVQLRAVLDRVERSLSSHLVYFLPKPRATYINDVASAGKPLQALDPLFFGRN